MMDRYTFSGMFAFSGVIRHSLTQHTVHVFHPVTYMYVTCFDLAETIIRYIYVGFQNVFLRCPTPRLHCFLSFHWTSFRFLSFMAFLISSIQFFFGLPRALFCFGIHFNAILCNLPSAILWTWPYHVSWFCSISFIIVSSQYIPSNTLQSVWKVQ